MGAHKKASAPCALDYSSNDENELSNDINNTSDSEDFLDDFILQQREDDERLAIETSGLSIHGSSSSSSVKAKPWPSDAQWTDYQVGIRGFSNTEQGLVVDDPVKLLTQVYAGSCNIPEGTNTCGDFASLLMPKTMWQTFADNSNSFVLSLQPNTKTHYAWKDSKPVTANELMRYAACIVYFCSMCRYLFMREWRRRCSYQD